MKKPPPEAMFNSLPDYLQKCLTPQEGDDLIVYHVKKGKAKEFGAFLLLIGFKYMNGYYYCGEGAEHTSVASENWANVRDLYNQINGTDYQAAAEVFFGKDGMKVTIG